MEGRKLFLLSFLLSLSLIGSVIGSDNILDLSHISEENNTRGVEPGEQEEDSQQVSKIQGQTKIIEVLVAKIEEVSYEGNFRGYGSVKKASLASIEATVNRLNKAVTTLLETSKTTLETLLEFNDAIARNTKDIASLKRRVSALESGSSSRPSTPTRSPSRPRPSSSKDEPCDGLLYQGRCYYAIFYVNSGGMSYSDGEDICREKGGTPGYFHRADHYKSMMKLMVSELKRKSPLISLDSISAVYLWLGLKIDFEDNKVVAEGGTQPIHQAWDYEYPSMNAAYTRVVVKVSQFPGDDGGMQNRKTTSKAAGILCMRSM